MIKDEDVYKIGYISKTHGLHGEVDFHFTDDIFDATESEYLLIRVDGIIVPFYIESCRFRSDTVAIVKFEDLDTAEQSQRLVGCDVCFERSKAAEADQEEVSITYFIGFTVTDTDGAEIGVITDVDTQTENWLFSVETPDERTIYIPVHEEFIQDIDHEHKRLQMDLPDGLLDL